MLGRAILLIGFADGLPRSSAATSMIAQLGHASSEMTRQYQRKRGRVNLTKAAGL